MDNWIYILVIGVIVGIALGMSITMFATNRMIEAQRRQYELSIRRLAELNEEKRDD